MRNRSHPILFRLNDVEYQSLKDKISRSGRKQEEYIRIVLSGTVLKEQPALDYYAMTKELHYIGHNLNQIATKANTTGDLDASEYKRQAALLREAILDIRRAVEAPEENK